MITEPKSISIKDNTIKFDTRDSDMALIPNNLDWRDKGTVTKVRYQGKCGSCWAFTAASLLETSNTIK